MNVEDLMALSSFAPKKYELKFTVTREHAETSDCECCGWLREMFENDPDLMEYEMTLTDGVVLNTLNYQLAVVSSTGPARGHTWSSI